VFFRRLAGEPLPWTRDPILRRYRFTNAYRASDRVSQYLIRRVLYQGDQDPRELLFRCLLFRFFNRISTWQLIADAIGEPRARPFDAARVCDVLTQARRQGARIYSSAYIIPSPSAFGSDVKHINHLRLLSRILADWAPERIVAAKTLEQVFLTLRAYPSLGNFLAYQLSIDLNYSSMVDFSEMEFVVPGPGAREGIRKCFSNWAKLDGAAVIRWVTESQSDQLSQRGLRMRTLWGRSLQLIDCQNLFCEVAKYARVAHPEATAIGGRRYVKQVFHPSVEGFEPWFPPKWDLNSRIGTDHSLRRAQADA
jgi:hypothetical protein